MRASIRGTEIYFDVEGMGLVPDGDTMRERPVAMVIHGGPGGDHSGFKPSYTPLAERMQLVYFDHRGQGRSSKKDPESLRKSIKNSDLMKQLVEVEFLRGVKKGNVFAEFIGLEKRVC